MTFQIQDNCGPADQRVHTNQDNEQGREVEEQQRKGNIGGVCDPIISRQQQDNKTRIFMTGDSRGARIFQRDALFPAALQTRAAPVRAAGEAGQLEVYCPLLSLPNGV